MLTKTDFLLYLDTPMHIWAKKNNRIEIEPTKHQIFLQDQGEEIGLLAKEYLHKKIGVSHPDHEIAIEKRFADERFKARADAMVFDPQAQTYDLYEIKSATSVKKINLYDVTRAR
jgi:hypothetical protein